MLRNDWVLVHADEIEIEPVGKGRPRTMRKGNRTVTVTPEKTRQFEKRLAWLMAGAVTLRQLERLKFKPGQPVGVSILAIHSRPQSMMGAKWPDGLIWKHTRPDGDNIGKACLDSLEKAGILHDDAQVVWFEVGKAYAEKTGKARISFELFALPEDEQQ